jgi:predicted nucleic acid-binding protein
MATSVLDASVFLSWLFPDEENERSNSLVQNSRDGDRIVVPAHWPVEIFNGLLVGHRRKRISSRQIPEFLDQLFNFPIEIEAALTLEDAKRLIVLGEKHSLTIYDATYLDLAQRKNLPLGTLDRALNRAALAERIALL